MTTTRPRLFVLRTTGGEYVGRVSATLTRDRAAAARLLKEDAEAALWAARTRDRGSPLRGLSLEELPKRTRRLGPTGGVVHLTLAAQAARQRATEALAQAERYERMAEQSRQDAMRAEHAARIAEGRAKAAEHREPV